MWKDWCISPLIPRLTLISFLLSYRTWHSAYSLLGYTNVYWMTIFYDLEKMYYKGRYWITVYILHFVLCLKMSDQFLSLWWDHSWSLNSEWIVRLMDSNLSNQNSSFRITKGNTFNSFRSCQCVCCCYWIWDLLLR